MLINVLNYLYTKRSFIFSDTDVYTPCTDKERYEDILTAATNRGSSLHTDYTLYSLISQYTVSSNSKTTQGFWSSVSE